MSKHKSEDYKLSALQLYYHDNYIFHFFLNMIQLFLVK